MVEFWWRPLVFIVTLGGIAGVFGASYSAAAGWALFSLCVVIYLMYHLRQLSRLTRWLAFSKELPDLGTGSWGDVLYRLDKQIKERQGEQLRALNELERMLEATRSLPDAVVMLDDQDRIQWMNAAAENLLGLNAARDVGQFVLYLLRQSRFTHWLQEAGYARPLQMASPVLPEKTLEFQLVPLPHRQRMLLARDISELARVEAMRRDFVANVSHELRTPITVLVGFMEAFVDMPDPDPAEFRKHIPLMLEQTNRITRLVDDLLTLARLETEPDHQEEVLDMASLLARLVNEGRAMSQGRHTFEMIQGTSARLRGNQQEIYSALANLVSNAVRYTPEGGSVRVAWQTGAHGEGLFSVMDTGEGIEAEHIPRLTERFYRVDRGRSRATGGTGLGLAIVKHVLQRHQAKLRVESVPGKGSTFCAVFSPERLSPAATEGGPEYPPEDAP